MSPINLVLFAEHSRKLPQKFTFPMANTKSDTAWKLLFSHILDFWAVAGTAAIMSHLFNHSMKLIMASNILTDAYSEQSIISLSFIMIPFIAFNYFFFSYFLNHGQTWGMHLMKKRIRMPHLSFKESAKWASHSFILCHSLGASIYFKKSHWQSYKEHDHLYHELMSYKEFKVIDLLEEVEKFEDKVPDFEYQEAA